MATTHIYVSLPITGYDIKEREAHAEDAKAYLKELFSEAEIHTPFDICVGETDYAKCMGADITCLLNCDIIAFCPLFEESKGCRLEHFAATTYEKKTMVLTPTSIMRGRALRKDWARVSTA